MAIRPMLIGVVLAAAGAFLLVTLTGMAASPEQETMPVAKAQSLIASGKNLERIPKATWQQLLTPEQYHILWEEGTEKPYTGALLDNKREGVYVTAGCRLPVFHSKHKYKSGTGWPSFWEVFNEENVVLKDDWSWGMHRMEVVSKCGEHLGHVFEDGPAPTGLRYCINSVALDFVPAAETQLPPPKAASSTKTE